MTEVWYADDPWDKLIFDQEELLRKGFIAHLWSEEIYVSKVELRTNKYRAMDKVIEKYGKKFECTTFKKMDR
jgi:hypothetical protein